MQVVVATGTLAYGIHMPCRAVVMAGDSPFLDALNFRQMSGRAGRRGLDNVGHVVFFSVPKVHQELMNSDLNTALLTLLGICSCALRLHPVNPSQPSTLLQAQ